MTFIKKITFQEKFSPFTKDTPITFWWEIEIQNLIEFYLKSKWNPNAHENAKRFKINCVLGNNGGGKSRLLYALANKSQHSLNTPIVSIEPENVYLPNVFYLDKLSAVEKNDSETIYSTLSTNNANWTEELWLDILTWNTQFSVVKNVFESFLWTDLQKENITIKISFDISKWQGFYDVELIKNLWIKQWLDYEKYKKYIDANKNKEKTQTQTEFIDEDTLKQWRNIDDFCRYINTRDSSETPFNSWNSEKNLYRKLYEENNDFLYFFIYSTGSLWKAYWNQNGKYMISPYDIVAIFWKDIKDHKAYKIYNDFFVAEHTEAGFMNCLNIFYEKISPGISFDCKIGGEEQGYINSWKENSSTFLSYFFIWFEFSSSINYSQLSDWQRIIISRFLKIYSQISDKKGYICTILIDEPDLHLHLDWQRQYIQKLIDVFSTLDNDIQLHFIIATHSPFIISDLPNECLVLLENWKPVDFKWKTFGANYIDLIQNGFFFQDKNLMGSFAENIIWDVAQQRREEITNNKKIENTELVEKIEWSIWDDFLRDNLLYFKKTKDAKS